jgi:HSF-type DNA-binding
MCISFSNDIKDKEIITSLTGATAEVAPTLNSTQESATPTRRMPPRRASGLRGLLEAEGEHSSDESEYTPPPAFPKIGSKRKTSGPRPHHPHIVTKHNYHDHASDPVEELSMSPLHGPKSYHGSSNGGKGGVVMAFPVKLYEMLHRVDVEGLEHIVSWQPHGRCFVVHDPKTFKEMLPKYFKLSKIASFQRQLNLYGFQRLTVGPDKNGYYNELFLRGRLDLARTIQRVKVKGTGVRAKSNPTDEPNLYELPAVDTVAVVTAPLDLPSDVPVPSTKYTSAPSRSQLNYISGENLPSFPSLPALLPGIEITPRDLSLIDMMEWEPPTKQDSISNNCSFVFSGDHPEPEQQQQHPHGNAFPKDKSDVNFDRLIDEMFRHDQNLDFSDLLKLASV